MWIFELRRVTHSSNYWPLDQNLLQHETRGDFYVSLLQVHREDPSRSISKNGAALRMQDSLGRSGKFITSATVKDFRVRWVDKILKLLKIRWRKARFWGSLAVDWSLWRSIWCPRTTQSRMSMFLGPIKCMIETDYHVNRRSKGRGNKTTSTVHFKRLPFSSTLAKFGRSIEERYSAPLAEISIQHH